MSTAGHTLVEGPGGLACTVCGKTWMALLADREFWRVGEPNIAHSGNLTENEVGELNALLEKSWSAVVTVGKP